METETKGHSLTIPVSNFQLSYDDVGEGNIPIGYFGVMVPPVSVKQCHFERSYKYIKI